MNTNDMNDIIDRYLDQAATTEETTALLDAMAADPALRAEFQAASTIKQAFDHELAATVVPEDLYSSIVVTAQAAGVLPTATATTTVAATSGTSTAISSALASFLGVMSAITVGVGIYTNAGRQLMPAAVVASAQPSHVARAVVAPATATSARTTLPESAWPRVIARQRGPIAAPAATSEVPVNAATEADASPERAIATSANGSHLELDRPSMQSSMHAEYPSISHQVNSLPIEVRLTSTPVVGYSYNGNGTSDLSSMGIEIDLRLSGEHAIGLNAHRDIMPMQVVRGGVPQPNEIMTWAGVHYRYTPSITLPLDVRPTVQLALGGSALGAVVMPTIGLHRTFDNVSVGIGADLLTFASQHQGAWQVATRTGLRLELGYRW